MLRHVAKYRCPPKSSQIDGPTSGFRGNRLTTTPSSVGYNDDSEEIQRKRQRQAADDVGRAAVGVDRMNDSGRALANRRVPRHLVHIVVRPDTVIRWHRAGFRSYWRKKSRRRCGRPTVLLEIRRLIREMSIANPLWGAPRIHGFSPGDVVRPTCSRR